MSVLIIKKIHCSQQDSSVKSAEDDATYEKVDQKSDPETLEDNSKNYRTVQKIL